ncbi:MAG TPA: hypothetical protein VK188_06465 [Holophaga sp.]|nr:hypothetical protein [Holophaga sp.]
MIDVYHSTRGEMPTILAVKVPFHTAGNRLNQMDPKDMHQEDGWMLVHQGLGTATHAHPYPFFTLYNRYRGLFRVMLLNAMDRSDSHYIGELSFLGGASSSANSAACFTFQDAERCFLDNHPQGDVQRATCVMAKAGDWAVFDYPMLGYDPALAQRDPVLLFRLIGINRSSIDLKGGGGLSLLQTLEGQGLALSGSSSSATGRLTVGLENGLRQFNSVTNCFDALTSERFKDAPWASKIQEFAKSRVGSFLPLAMGLAGFIDAFFGGADSASPWEPLSIKGEFDLKVTGGLENVKELWAHAFYMKPGQPSVRAQRPVQKIPWGIFNFPSAPIVKVTPAPSVLGGNTGFQVVLAQDPGILFNPDAGLEVTSVKVAFMGADPKNLQVSALTKPGDTGSSPSELVLRTGFMDIKTALATPLMTAGAFDMVPFLRWEIRFRTRTATKYMDPEQVLIKNFRWVNPAAERPVEAERYPGETKILGEAVQAHCAVM